MRSLGRLMSKHDLKKVYDVDTQNSIPIIDIDFIMPLNLRKPSDFMDYKVWTLLTLISCESIVSNGFQSEIRLLK